MSTLAISKETLQAERKERLELRAAGDFKNPKIKKLNVLEALNSITDSQMLMAMQDLVCKAVESYDLTGIRFVSMYDQVATLANSECVYTDIIEKNGIVRSTDFQVRWREEQANPAATVQFFNLNAGLPNEAEMTRTVVGNTMGAYGNQINIRFIADELAAQSPIAPTDERAKQVNMQMVRMKRFRNSHMLSNTESKSEIIGDTPQWGGFLTRSTSYNTTFGTGTDLTSALIQTQVNSIANASSVNGLSYHRPLIALTTNSQIGKIRDLMIARFPGEKSNSYLDYQAQLENDFPGYDLPASMVRMYQADPGCSVAFVHEPQLASGATLFFDPTQPRIAKFQMMGQYGPWVLERPTPELTTLLCVFDFESLVDPLVVSRAALYGVN
jgi:hypothetical protein